MKNSIIAAICALLIIAIPVKANIPQPIDKAYQGTIKLKVDATNLSQRIFQVNETIPVTSGKLTLLYPAWIPGHHSPVGPINKLAGLKINADGNVIKWQRDAANVYAFNLTVPNGIDEISVSFQFLSPQNSNQGRVVMTPEMLNLQWNTVALYPAGYYSSKIKFSTSVLLPKGWSYTTALATKSQHKNRVKFKTIDFENLVDSPMFAGRFYKKIALNDSKKTPIYLNVFADKEKDLAITKEGLEAHKNLIEQMTKVYGAYHFDHYDFLLALTKKLGGIGMEHHRSSENSAKPFYFTDWKKSWLGRDLLAHEFNHSWDGKYRRPEKLWTPTFNQIKQANGLWVYEGQTQYWGQIFSVRSGLWSHKQGMAVLAMLAARYDKGRPGMQWRNILDTTNDPTISKRAPLPFRNYQMSEDYYSGGELIWLAVDAKLRDLSKNHKSLDDFAKAFFGVNDGDWSVNTYNFADVVNTLNKLEAYNWHDFLQSRLTGHQNLSKSFNDQGWQLVYNDKPSVAVSAGEAQYKSTDFVYSLGFSVSHKGTLRDVIWDSPAFNAGLSPSMTIIAVNNEEFSGEALKDVVTSAKTNKHPIELLIKDFDHYKTIKIDYTDGLKYPHLERIKDKPDYLSQVLTAR